MSEDSELERIRVMSDKVDSIALNEGIENRLKVNRELGFDRGVSVICSLLMQHGDLRLNQLAIDYVANLMATPLGEKLASMDYEHREQIIRALDPTKGTLRT